MTNFFCAGLLDVAHACQQNAGVADEKTPRLEQDAYA